MKIFRISVLLSFLLLQTMQSQIFVSTLGSASGDGTSWQKAFNDLQKAIGAAKAGQEIWVQKGHYYPSLDRTGLKPANPRNATFVLKDGVKLYGGFAGSETSLSQRNAEENETVLSGDIGAVGDYSDNVYVILLGVDLSSSSRIDGFTITGANNDQSGINITIGGYSIQQSSGGAGRILSSDIAVANNKFTANRSRGTAGGLAVLHGSRLSLLNNLFSANETGNQGGALYSVSSSVSFEGCVFRDNAAGQGAAAYIVNNQEPGIISSCTFKGNIAKADGGALLFYSSDPMKRNEFKIADCGFESNSCITGGVLNGLRTIASRGGAIYADRTDLDISGCSFAGQIIDYTSSAGASGGAVDLGYDTSVKIDRCLFLNNKAVPKTTGTSGSGGAVHTMSDFEITNCVFAGNYARGGGGAVELSDDQPSVKPSVMANCVFYSNAAGADGGAVYYGTGLVSVPTGFTNLTFYQNTAARGGAMCFNTYSDIGQGTQLQNCIFEGNSTDNLAYSGTFQPSNLASSNNYFQAENSSGSVFSNPGDPAGRDGIWATADDGLHLDLCSALADSGINEGLILPGMKSSWSENEDDVAGGRRIRGEQVEMGAYENDRNAAPALLNPLPDLNVRPGSDKVEIDLDKYFFTAAGSVNSYRVSSTDHESGLYTSLLSGSTLTISFHQTKTGSGQLVITAANHCGLVSEQALDIQVSESLSAEEFNANPVFIYPVPAVSEITVSGSQPLQSYRVLNMLGQTVRSGQFNGRRADVAMLASGAYFIEIKSEDKLYTVKFYKS